MQQSPPGTHLRIAAAPSCLASSVRRSLLPLLAIPFRGSAAAPSRPRRSRPPRFRTPPAPSAPPPSAASSSTSTKPSSPTLASPSPTKPASRSAPPPPAATAHSSSPTFLPATTRSASPLPASRPSSPTSFPFTPKRNISSPTSPCRSRPNSTCRSLSPKISSPRSRSGRDQAAHPRRSSPTSTPAMSGTPAPLKARHKFQLAIRSAIDPMTFATTAAIAGEEQLRDKYSGYGDGIEGFGKRFGAAYGDVVIGRMIGGAILPSLFRQGPRATSTRAPAPFPPRLARHLLCGHLPRKQRPASSPTTPTSSATSPPGESPTSTGRTTIAA